MNTGNLEISTDKQRLDVDAIHAFLRDEIYWAQNRTLEQTQTAIENSLCFGALHRWRAGRLRTRGKRLRDVRICR